MATARPSVLQCLTDQTEASIEVRELVAAVHAGRTVEVAGEPSSWLARMRDWFFEHDSNVHAKPEHRKRCPARQVHATHPQSAARLEIAAFLFYGGWAFFASRAHGVGPGLRALLTQVWSASSSPSRSL